MQFDWPDTTSSAFQRETLRARHDLHNDARFSDDGLADLLDRFPRDQMGIYTFPKHAEGRIVPATGTAENVSGKDLLDVVKRGQVWLNLRNASGALSDYRELCDGLFDGLDAASGQRTFRRDLGVLISSPNTHVHYHLDIPLVLLVQVRGEKRIWLYPAEERFAEGRHVEAIALREREEDLPFHNEFDADAEIIDMQPGMAITWPQNAPHRVQNADVMNVSLSCEFLTMRALVKANAIHANGVLRRKLGADPRLPSGMGPGAVAKAALSRAYKLVQREVPSPPKVASFRIDPDAESGITAVPPQPVG